jgi:hypothetical protein
MGDYISHLPVSERERALDLSQGERRSRRQGWCGPLRGGYLVPGSFI